MPVVVTCPACQRKARVSRSAVGKSVKCPGCGVSFPAARSGATPPPIPAAADLADAPDYSEPPEGDSRRVTRTGIGLLTISQALLAGGTAMKLLLALISLVTSDSTTKSSLQESFTEFVTVASTLAVLAAVITATIGAVYCAVAPGANSVRAAAVSVLVLSLLGAVQAPAGSVRDAVSGPNGIGRGSRNSDYPTPSFAGLMLMLTMAPEAFEAARQAMLAIYARSQAGRLGDQLAAGTGGLLAVAYPGAVIGMIVFGIGVHLFSGKPHPTFDQVLAVLVLLAKTVLVALGALVLLRVSMRLRPA